MVTLQDSLVSSSARRLPFRKRPDLSARRQHYLGRSYWVIKEPLGLRYFRFQEEEYAILQMLDGNISMDDIKDRFEADFPPQKITLEELQQFLGMLHQSGLVVANVPGQGRQLEQRRSKRKRQEIFQAASNILSIRFKGFDPERLLNWIYPFVKWFFSIPMFVVWLVFSISALSLVIVEFDVFRSKLPEFNQFFNVHNAFLLAITLGITKIFHEFGHGLSCKHFGGECHEMGVMFLVFTPCLYCNVSDSWMLPSKWQRAMIGAAGMYTEIFLASICTFLWWYSTPGLFNNLCLNVMFIASVTTLLFNANPLLRYDGYYILADLSEIPNLRQKATTILSRKMGEWFLGMEMPDDPFLPEGHQFLFATFSIAAAFYRWFITFSICWFLYKLFASYDLQVIGQMIVAASLWSLLVMPLYKLGKFFYVPGRFEKVKKARMYLTLTGLAAILGFILFVPLPNSVLAPFEIQAKDADPVYVDVPGRLASLKVATGAKVEAQQLLAQLEDVDIDLEIAQLRGNVEQSRQRLSSLNELRYRDPKAAYEVPQVEEALKAAEDQLAKKETDRNRLRLVAPVAGTVLPPPYTEKHDDPNGQLPMWHGIPLEARNTGAFLQEGVLFCEIGDPKRLEAVMVIDQQDRNQIWAGQPVELKIDELPHLIFKTKIDEIAESELRVSPRRLSSKSGGELSTKTDTKTGQEHPISTSYQARASIGDQQGVMLLGLRGTARVYVQWIPLGTRFWRFLTHTFNFKL